MANQPQSRPWFRLASKARPTQPLAPPPTPAPRPQMRPPAALLPRPTMTQPTFRPSAATQPQPGQNTAPPLPSITPASGPPPLPPPSVAVSPVSPPKPLPRIATTSPVTQTSPPTSPVTQKSPASSATQKSPLASPVTQNLSPASPVTQKSPLASPVTQNPPPASPVTQKSHLASPVTQKSPLASFTTHKSPPASPVTQKSSPASPVIQTSPLTSTVAQNTLASPVTQKYHSAARASPLSSTIPSPSSLPSSPKPKIQSPPPSIPTSPATKQEVVARSVPPSPAKHSLPSPPPKPASPYAKQIVSPSNGHGLDDASSNPPVPSPRAAKPLPETPPESPKIKPALHSPPLFTLPPQFKSNGEYEKIIPAITEQKTVLHVKDTIGKSRSFQYPYGDNSEDIAGLRVITISGENRGAIMELGYSPRTHGNPHAYLSNHDHKLRSDGELCEGNSRGNEGRSKMEGRNHNARVKPSMPMKAFMNSNVQSINSSIVLNTTLSHHDPGAHLSLLRNPIKGYVKDHSDGHDVFHKEAGYRFSN